MIKDDKPSQEIEIKEYNEFNLTDLTGFYKALNSAISTNNIQSLYKLSKIFARSYFKQLEN